MQQIERYLLPGPGSKAIVFAWDRPISGLTPAARQSSRRWHWWLVHQCAWRTANCEQEARLFGEAGLLSILHGCFFTYSGLGAAGGDVRALGGRSSC